MLILPCFTFPLTREASFILNATQMFAIIASVLALLFDSVHVIFLAIKNLLFSIKRCNHYHGEYSKR